MGVTRREFLRAAAAAVGLNAVGGLTAAFAPMTESAQSRKLVEEENLKRLRDLALDTDKPNLYKSLQSRPEYASCVLNVITYRKELGLHSLPPEISNYDPEKAKTIWEQTSPAFKNELPPSMVRVANTAELLLKLIYGHQITKTVRGIKPSDGTNFGDGTIGYPLFYSPNKRDIIMVLIHEGAGHGVDPGIYSRYPPEMFFQMEEAKWRMLAQAFKIEGQYLNLPEDGVHKSINAFLGEAALLALKNDNNFQNLLGSDRIINLIGSNPPTVFTKQFVYSLGQKINADIRDGHNFFFQTKYEDKLSRYLSEIYAEMIKWSILPRQIFSKSVPETLIKTQVNEEIVAAVTESVRLFVGNEVDLVRLRETITALYQLMPEILEDQSQSSLPTLTPEQVIYQRTEKIMDDFYQKSKLPTEATVLLGLQDRDLFNQYLRYYLTIIKKYPGAGEQHVDSEASINAFDPPTLDFWESKIVTDAMDKSTLKRLIQDALSKKWSPDNATWLKEKTPILKSFIAKEKLSP